MIKIEKASLKNAEVLALLGRITYIESHGHFIEDRKDLIQYVDHTFSVSNLLKELEDPKVLYYLAFVDELPVAYIKLVLDAKNENVKSNSVCLLERIYVLNEFIPKKIGHQLLAFAEEKTKELEKDTLWLSVYIKNERAIRFYQKNQFINIGYYDFLVNGIVYENHVFSKEYNA